MLADAKERELATDPAQSFIVQAPAGSGKTEILTQRYLRLLGTVSTPEQIVALTFTKKAAHEMRERIISALQEVLSATPADTPHRKKTHHFAQIALARDKQYAWHLLEHPWRLRILTIDALCQTITQAIPLQEQHIPYATIANHPDMYYQQAAKSYLDHALADSKQHNTLETLLLHLDNRQDQLITLLSQLLASREQWLQLVYQAKQQDRTHYEQALLLIEQHELARFHQSLPESLHEALTALVNEFMHVLNAHAHHDNALLNWPSFKTTNKEQAAALSRLLLTQSGTLRKAFDHHVGLTRSICDEKHYKTLKTQSKALLATLDTHTEFLTALQRVSKLPDPHYDDYAWQVLQTLLSVLPVLTAHLHWVFAKHHVVDFQAVAMSALLALGDEHAPTDLALYLDHRIHHLLVDEFQDTSIQQFELLTRLVQGFQADDGKTVFVVGDPMQSIYRFRKAEVGLFLKVMQQGLGPVSLTSLQLTCNFRATHHLIDWTNHHFKCIFPQQNDIESGAISFSPSQSTKISTHDTVKACQYADKISQAHGLVDIVQQELTQFPQHSIAVLVRSRRQLSPIIDALKAAHIPFQGVEIDLLSHLPHIRDVWSLTEAMLTPGNRLAWLSTLRSPLCGLALSDLEIIANIDKKRSIYYALNDENMLSKLSTEGRLRAQYMFQVLQHAFTRRSQQSLVDWIRQTLEQFHIAHILSSEEMRDLEQYWLLLDQYEQNGGLPDMGQFKTSFNEYYSKIATPAKLQIMTIHKSKGLEFDCVILPALSAKSRNKTAPLLRFLNLPRHHHELLLVSPLKAAHETHNPLYDYIVGIDEEKNAYEQQRLLYVAVTRARSRLYLLDYRDKGETGSFRDMLKQQPFEDMTSQETETTTSFKLPFLWHLPIEFYRSSPSYSTPQATITHIPQQETARLIGVVTHELLQWIANHHPQYSNIPWQMSERALQAHGLTGQLLDEAMSKIQQQITDLLQDATGQWIMDTHEAEHNEYAYLIETSGEIETRMIDRTFIDNGCRWIIDFKTGYESALTETTYRSQLNEYAQAFAHLPHDIWCGIYYLETQHWVTWPFGALT